MSPTVFHERGFRFFIFSREEPRIHIHVHCGHGEAKFWLEPQVRVAENYGLTDSDLRTVSNLIKEHDDEIRDAWRKHFGR